MSLRFLRSAACAVAAAFALTAALAPASSRADEGQHLGDLHNQPCGVSTAPPETYRHVIWILFENHTYSDIIGSPNNPYINQVAAECGSATNFTAAAHPSLPNYIAMTSGGLQGVDADHPPSFYPLDVPSIFSQLGSDWRGLDQSMTTNCEQVNDGFYAVRHNPAAYYTNIREACLAQDVPLTDTPDLSARFTFVTPDTCSDMHSCPLGSDTVSEQQRGDAWLAGFLPKVFASRQYRTGRTAVFITWDEGRGANQTIPTIVASPYTPAGTESAEPFTHYSLLHTTEQMLGLDYLGEAATASSMRPAFGL